MKMCNLNKLFILAFLALCSLIILSVTPARASGVPVVPLTINYTATNSLHVAHDYFNPTFPACTPADTVTLRLKNATSHAVHLNIYHDSVSGNLIALGAGKTIAVTTTITSTTPSDIMSLGISRVEVWTVEKYPEIAFINLC